VCPRQENQENPYFEANQYINYNGYLCGHLNYLL
jgi:hypothetical protein